MFIITHVKELSIWTTETPFDKRSGIWSFYDTREEYDFALEDFKKTYGTKFMMPLSRVMKLFGSRNQES